MAVTPPSRSSLPLRSRSVSGSVRAAAPSESASTNVFAARRARTSEGAAASTPERWTTVKAVEVRAHSLSALIASPMGASSSRTPANMDVCRSATAAAAKSAEVSSAMKVRSRMRSRRAGREMSCAMKAARRSRRALASLGEGAAPLRPLAGSTEYECTASQVREKPMSITLSSMSKPIDFHSRGSESARGGTSRQRVIDPYACSVA